MDTTALVDKAIHEGKAIVEKLDEKGLYFPLAMWSYYPESSEWRLVLGKEGIQEVGARDSYRKIQTILNKWMPESEISVNEISVIDTDNEVARLIRKAFRARKAIPGGRFGGYVLDGKSIPDSYIYRAAR